MLQHPALPLLLAAPLALLLRGKPRQILLLAAPILAYAVLAAVPAGGGLTHSLPGYTLQLLRVDKLSVLFGVVFCVITFAGLLYGLHQKKVTEAAASLALAGAALGVVFAGDWITMFVCWELMSVSSIFIIWLGGTDAAHRAGLRYLLVHVLGGGLLFAGILLHLSSGGDPAFTFIGGGELTPAAWLILAGFAVNAAIPPLHPWLTDSYPECTISGSVVQSAFTTKTAVYVLLRAFPGTEVLAVLGTVMAVYGVVYAVMENNIRRLLAYHIVSQVGFMVAGVGIGTALSTDGAAAHAFCHILYKGLLFMGAGAVLYAAGKEKLTELGGLWHRIPVVMILFMVGALSISGLPPFNGFISKSMTISAAGIAHHPTLEFFLELASVGTFLSIGLKLAYFAFFGEDRELTCREIPANMTLAMTIAAVLCTLIGIFPDFIYRMLPGGSEYHPYTASHVLSSIQLHLGTAAGFWLMLKVLHVKPKIALDFDWLYRKPFAWGVGILVSKMREFGTFLKEDGVALVYAAVPYEYDVDSRRAPLGASLFWVTVFFAAVALSLL